MSELQWPKADWETWAYMPTATISGAVLLSLGLEPEPTCLQHDHFQRPGITCDRRLKIASAHLSLDGPLRPLGRWVIGHGADTVSLGEFAAWAIGMGWELPERFPRATAPAQTAAPAETTEQRQDRRLRVCESRGLVMPKSSAGRLPDGVGNAADYEGATRQAFSADVKKALKRRESAQREGTKVHRA